MNDYICPQCQAEYPEPGLCETCQVDLVSRDEYEDEFDEEEEGLGPEYSEDDDENEDDEDENEEDDDENEDEEDENEEDDDEVSGKKYSGLNDDEDEEKNY